MTLKSHSFLHFFSILKMCLFYVFKPPFCLLQAIEYSKNIPKPNVKARPNQYNSYEVAAQLSPAAKKSGPPSPTQTVDVIDLQKLKQRHDQEKQNVASIRQNMESVPQKA